MKVIKPSLKTNMNIGRYYEMPSSSRGPVLYLFYAPPAVGGGWNAVPLSRIDVVDQKLLKLPAYLCN